MDSFDQMVSPNPPEEALALTDFLYSKLDSNLRGNKATKRKEQTAGDVCGNFKIEKRVIEKNDKYVVHGLAMLESGVSISWELFLSSSDANLLIWSLFNLQPIKHRFKNQPENLLPSENEIKKWLSEKLNATLEESFPISLNLRVPENVKIDKQIINELADSLELAITSDTNESWSDEQSRYQLMRDWLFSKEGKQSLIDFWRLAENDVYLIDQTLKVLDAKKKLNANEQKRQSELKEFLQLVVSDKKLSEKLLQDPQVMDELNKLYETMKMSGEAIIDSVLDSERELRLEKCEQQLKELDGEIPILESRLIIRQKMAGQAIDEKSLVDSMRLIVARNLSVRNPDEIEKVTTRFLKVLESWGFINDESGDWHAKDALSKYFSSDYSLTKEYQRILNTMSEGLAQGKIPELERWLKKEIALFLTGSEGQESEAGLKFRQKLEQKLLKMREAERRLQLRGRIDVLLNRPDELREFITSIDGNLDERHEMKRIWEACLRSVLLKKVKFLEEDARSFKSDRVIPPVENNFEAIRQLLQAVSWKSEASTNEEKAELCMDLVERAKQSLVLGENKLLSREGIKIRLNIKNNTNA